MTTFEHQKIDINTFGAHASIITRAQEKCIQFDKPGTIFGCNAYSFGKYVWEVKILSNGLFSAEGNVLRIGVSGVKSKVVHGVDVEYQNTRGALKIKVMVDMEAGSLYIFNSSSQQPENAYNLPEGPVIPAIQYKPAKSSTAPVRISVDFDITSNSCFNT